MMGAMYVQAIVDSLNGRYFNLYVFNVSKLFIPKYYSSDEEVHITMSEKWFERSIIRSFGFTLIEIDASRVKLLEFVETFDA